MTERLSAINSPASRKEMLDYYQHGVPLSSAERDDAYEESLLNFDTLKHEVETHHPRLLDESIDLRFIEPLEGVF